jgi:hypothetical protein
MPGRKSTRHQKCIYPGQYNQHRDYRENLVKLHVSARRVQLPVARPERGRENN